MKKILAGGSILVAILALGIISFGNNHTQPSNLNSIQPASTSSVSESKAEKVIPTCNGTTVTASCVEGGISYISYVYHPAVAEVSHTESVTTYQKEVSGYCTLCSDGTYSPSCATGRGACSHHGGVAQWNAPRYRSVPLNTNKTVVDSTAKEAYYEKVAR